LNLCFRAPFRKSAFQFHFVFFLCSRAFQFRHSGIPISDVFNLCCCALISELLNSAPYLWMLCFPALIRNSKNPASHVLLLCFRVALRFGIPNSHPTVGCLFPRFFSELQNSNLLRFDFLCFRASIPEFRNHVRNSAIQISHFLNLCACVSQIRNSDNADFHVLILCFRGSL
jgi:hypothetical protein